MANLIITVIAIALVAVASLMGAYYGGSAFLNNQSAANASTVLNQGQQLAGAWQAYLGDNLNTPPTTAAALITANYLAQIPTAPAAAGSVNAAPIFIGFANTHYYAYADVGHPSTSTPATDPNASACLRIVKTATGSNTQSIQSLAPGAIASTTGTSGSGNATFGCGKISSAPTAPTGFTNTGTAPVSGDYVMEYMLQ